MASKKGESLEFEIEGHVLKLSNLDKVYYPEPGFTKGQVIDYYAKVAPAIIPHLMDRPLTMKRYPDGVEGENFYQKEAPSHRPDWVKTVPIPSETKARDVPYILCNDLATLLWLVNLADLEFHPLLSRAPALDTPTLVAFDLDPGPPAGMQSLAQVALALKDALKSLGLESFPKTSGSKGLHVYVPLNRPGASFDDTRSFSLAVATEIQKQHPHLVTINMRKDLRLGKVLIDYSQNSTTKTTTCVYSLRAKSKPTASTPLHWNEVEEAAIDYKVPLAYEADAVIRRFESRGDLFRPVLELKQKLPKP
jgi:bifunctional non-homologous end joining protein LigD